MFISLYQKCKIKCTKICLLNKELKNKHEKLLQELSSIPFKFGDNKITDIFESYKDSYGKDNANVFF